MMVSLFGNGLGPQQGIQTQATLQSPFPTQAGNVEVTFDGKPAPLTWVQDAQINAVAPWSLIPGQTTQVCVSYQNVKTNCLTVPVAQTSPGVFTIDGVHAAALNQDGTINSADHPAPVGSIISVLATGLGPIDPAQGDGTLVGFPLPTNTAQVAVQAIAVTIAFSGAGRRSITPFVVTYARARAIPGGRDKPDQLSSRQVCRYDLRRQQRLPDLRRTVRQFTGLSRTS